MLVSSHQLNEVEEFADRVVILNRGQLVRAGSIAALTAGTDSVLVRTPNAPALVAALAVNAIAAINSNDDSFNGVHLLSAGGGVIVLLLWAFVPAILGAGITMNRDIT